MKVGNEQEQLVLHATGLFTTGHKSSANVLLLRLLLQTALLLELESHSDFRTNVGNCVTTHFGQKNHMEYPISQMNFLRHRMSATSRTCCAKV